MCFPETANYGMLHNIIESQFGVMVTASGTETRRFMSSSPSLGTKKTQVVALGLVILSQP